MPGPTLVTKTMKGQTASCPLDGISDVTAAFSLRYLLSSYAAVSGYVCRVTSDGTGEPWTDLRPLSVTNYTLVSSSNSTTDWATGSGHTAFRLERWYNQVDNSKYIQSSNASGFFLDLTGFGNRPTWKSVPPYRYYMTMAASAIWNIPTTGHSFYFCITFNCTGSNLNSPHGQQTIFTVINDRPLFMLSKAASASLTESITVYMSSPGQFQYSQSCSFTTSALMKTPRIFLYEKVSGGAYGAHRLSTSNFYSTQYTSLTNLTSALSAMFTTEYVVYAASWNTSNRFFVGYIPEFWLVVTSGSVNSGTIARVVKNTARHYSIPIN